MKFLTVMIVTVEKVLFFLFTLSVIAPVGEGNLKMKRLYSGTVWEISKLRISIWYKVAIFCLVTIMIQPSFVAGNRMYFIVYRVVIGFFLLIWGINKCELPIRRMLPVAAYCVAIVFSAVNNNRSFGTLSNSIAMVIVYIDFFLVISRFLDRYDLFDLYTLLVRFLGIYVVLSDISIMTMDVVAANSQYFVGNKFFVSYLHWVWLALYSYQLECKQRKGYRLVILTLFTVSFIFIAYIECTTGIIGLVLLAILVVLSNTKLCTFLLRRRMIPIWCAVSLALFFSIEAILSNSAISKLITIVLGENMTLTGRTVIFQYIAGIIAKSPLFGYGYETDILKSVLGWGGNVQNGFMQIIVFYGIVGLASFLLMVLCVSRVQNKDDSELIPCIRVIVLFIVASIIEIAFEYYFMLFLAIMYCGCKYLKKKADNGKIEDF